MSDVLPALAANSSPNVVFIGNGVSGPYSVKSLGRERAILSFAQNGGERRGHVLRYVHNWRRAHGSILAESSGEVTPRPRELGAVLDRVARVSLEPSSTGPALRPTMRPGWTPAQDPRRGRRAAGPGHLRRWRHDPRPRRTARHR